MPLRNIHTSDKVNAAKPVPWDCPIGLLAGSEKTIGSGFNLRWFFAAHRNFLSVRYVPFGDY
jgi:hypothetical protein